MVIFNCVSLSSGELIGGRTLGLDAQITAPEAGHKVTPIRPPASVGVQLTWPQVLDSSGGMLCVRHKKEWSHNDSLPQFIVSLQYYQISKPKLIMLMVKNQQQPCSFQNGQLIISQTNFINNCQSMPYSGIWRFVRGQPSWHYYTEQRSATDIKIVITNAKLKYMVNILKEKSWNEQIQEEVNPKLTILSPSAKSAPSPKHLL